MVRGLRPRTIGCVNIQPLNAVVFISHPLLLSTTAVPPARPPARPSPAKKFFVC